MLIERDGKLHPIEFRKTATPSLRAAKTFRAIATLDREIGPGAIVCLVDQIKPLSAMVTAVPVSAI